MTQRLLQLIGLSSLAGGVALSRKEDLEGTTRFLRTSYHLAIATSQYVRLLKSDLAKDKTSLEYRSAMEDLHSKSAERMLYVCKKHGGCFTKLGQYVASLRFAVPKEFTNTLSVLQDRAQSLPLSSIEGFVSEEIGAPINEVFRSFSPEAVAAASLAQVHFAETVTGQKVAVKVQYPGLEKQVAGDIATLTFLTKKIGYLFPDFEYTWLIPEFNRTAQLELDFRQEARNSERVAEMFKADKDVYVPKVLNEYSSRRILVMEFIEGCKVDDIQAIQSLGIETRKVKNTLLKVFGDMLHVYGFVHCDPHPGNMMVRWDPNNPKQHQLVVLDHGMYRRFTSQFRFEYCGLWHDLILRDTESGVKRLSSMGITVPEKYYELLSLILTMRPPSHSGQIGSKLTAEIRKDLQEKYHDFSMGDANDFMQQLPRDMLFAFRTITLLAALNAKLGGTTRERLLIFSDCAARGLLLYPHRSEDKLSSIYDDISRKVDAERSPLSFLERWAGTFHLIFFRLYLWSVDVVITAVGALSRSQQSSS